LDTQENIVKELRELLQKLSDESQALQRFILAMNQEKASAAGQWEASSEEKTITKKKKTK
jgi:cob(I)alamin adenosyltransferase